MVNEKMKMNMEMGVEMKMEIKMKMGMDMEMHMQVKMEMQMRRCFVLCGKHAPPAAARGLTRRTSRRRCAGPHAPQARRRVSRHAGRPAVGRSCRPLRLRASCMSRRYSPLARPGRRRKAAARAARGQRLAPLIPTWWPPTTNAGTMQLPSWPPPRSDCQGNTWCSYCGH